MKKLAKDTKDMVLTGVTMGIGSKMISGAGGSAAPIASMSSMMPTLGTVVGSSAVLRKTKKMKL